MAEDMARPPMIVLVGVDGSGKTSICRKTMDALTAERIKASVVWSRFSNYLSKPLLAVTRLTGHNRRFVAGGEKLAHHDFSRLVGYRELFVALQAIDVNIGAALRIGRHWRRTDLHLIICERGPWDTVVDVLADVGGHVGSYPFFQKLATWQLRKAVKVVLVRRDCEKIFDSRPGLRHDPTLVQRAQLYEAFAERLGWAVVDNNGSLEDAVSRFHCLCKEATVGSV